MNVSRPRIEKNPAPIGETLIGVSGANMRALSNGHHIAAPNPPSVNVSSNPWLAIARVRNANPARLRASLQVNEMNPANRAAKTNECVAPRCPHPSAYSIPNRNPITSASGMTVKTAPAMASFGEMTPRPAAAANASGTIACVKTVGIQDTSPTITPIRSCPVALTCSRRPRG